MKMLYPHLFWWLGNGGDEPHPTVWARLLRVDSQRFGGVGVFFVVVLFF